MADFGNGAIVSVVVCTRNRAEKLVQALNRFSRLADLHSWELVVVDNGSTDGTFEAVKAIQPQCQFALRLVREPKKGLSRARNTGIDVSTAPLIAFTDDDCYPDDEYIASLIKTFSDRSVAYCGGRVRLFDPNDQRVTIQEDPTHKHIVGGSFIPSGMIHGANMAFRREVFSRMGGFDTRLGAGTLFCSGEDTDMLRRASAAGFNGVYDPSVGVFHHHGRSSVEDAARLMRGYWRGRGAAMAKYLVFSRAEPVYFRLRRCYWQLRLVPLRQKASEVLWGMLYVVIVAIKS